MSSCEPSSRLGLRLDSCPDGISEIVTEIDPTGRAGQAEISVGCRILEIAGEAATAVKVGLASGMRALPASAVSMTIVRPGESEPVTVIVPALDENAPERATPFVEAPRDDDDLLHEISFSISANAADKVTPPETPFNLTAQQEQPLARPSRPPVFSNLPQIDLDGEHNTHQRAARKNCPAERNRMRLGVPMQNDRVLDLLRNPHKPPRDPYTCVQDYDPFADERWDGDSSE